MRFRSQVRRMATARGRDESRATHDRLDRGRRASVGARSAPVWTCTFDTLEGAWVVESVATLPEYRRRGLVDSLMSNILEMGRARGHRLAQLTILIGNTAAQRAYEKAGFKVDAEKRDRNFEAALGAPGFMRMVRDY